MSKTNILIVESSIYLPEGTYQHAGAYKEEDFFAFIKSLKNPFFYLMGSLDFISEMNHKISKEINSHAPMYCFDPSKAKHDVEYDYVCFKTLKNKYAILAK